MFRALVDRDPAFDGVFVVGVRTTGIFCRPICPARKPRPENVEYFPTPACAIAAGYRPCRRCRPTRAPGAHPPWVEHLLDRLTNPSAARVTDADLRDDGISPTRARRYWREHFGMTVHAYQRAQRLGVAMDRIKEGRGLTSAGFASGYESDSGFRDAFKAVFGSPPGQARQTTYAKATVIPTPLGPLLAAATKEQLWFLEFLDRRGLMGQGKTLVARLGQPILPGINPILKETAGQLNQYFAGKRTQFDLPIALSGTPFQERVWRALLEIEYGATASYIDIAQEVGAGRGSRAVGRANGMNRIAIVIPCHRVIRKDGTLSGYGGGLWRKRRLLELEGVPLGEDSSRTKISGCTLLPAATVCH